MRKKKSVVHAPSERTHPPAISSVLLDKRVLAGFRKRAKAAYPREYIVVMFGKITDDVAEVHVMLPLPHDATRNAIDYDHDDIELLAEEVSCQGLVFVGTCHTHPCMNTCSHPSETDHETGVRFHEPVMGVLWLRKVDGVMRSTFSLNIPRQPVKLKYALKS